MLVGLVKRVEFVGNHVSMNREGATRPYASGMKDRLKRKSTWRHSTVETWMGQVARLFGM